MTSSEPIPVLSNLVVSETSDYFNIKMEVGSFNTENVNITPWGDSLIIELHAEHEQGQSYYLGELEPEYFKRVIPLGINVSDNDLQSSIDLNQLIINVKKPTTETALNKETSMAAA